MKFKLLRSIVATTATLTTIPLATIGLASCGNNSSTTITLDKTSLSLSAGEISTITATVNPSTATVTWTSSNTSIATVSDGTVTAVAAGTATITATANGQSATCTVTVTEAHIVVPESEKTHDVGVNDYAIYSITLKDSISDVSELNVSATTTDTSYDVFATINSFKSNTLKVKVTASAKSNTNSTSVVFNLTVAKADGSWTQTASNLTMTGLDDIKTTYTITYGPTPSGLTFNSRPTTITENTAVNITYSLATTDYTINSSACSVIVGTTNVTSKCSISNNRLVIPSGLVKDDITVTLATAYQQDKYNVSYSFEHVTKSSCPTTVNAGSNLVATYTLASGYTRLLLSSCTVMSGSSNITAYCTITNTSITVPSTAIVGDLTITLVATNTSDTGSYTVTAGECKEITLDNFIEQTGEEELIVAGVQRILYLVPDADSKTFTATFTETFSDTLIFMNTAKSTYNITFNGVTISNAASNELLAAPIFFAKSKNKSTINLTLSGTNTLLDKRTISTAGYYDEDAVFKSQSKLNISGSGSLYINNLSSNKGIYGKGIQTTKGSAINISGGTVNVFALDSAIQADGPLTISGGTVTADSYYDDGIKTKFADPEDDLSADTFNIEKDITISGGTVNVYSARNGINSAHDVITSSSAEVNIYTTTTNAGSKVGSATLDELNMYVKIPASCISYSELEDHYFTATFNDGTVEYLTLKKIKTSDGGGPRLQSGETYYYFKCDRPLSSSCSSFVINKYANASFGLKTPTAEATSSSISISNPASTSNTNDTVSITSISGTTISTSGSLNDNYKSCIGQGTSIDTTVGSKGIKAKNEVTLNGGTINIESNDTGITAGYGNIFCNTAEADDVTYSTGNITINGATVNIASNSGDGVKAYGIAETKSGTLNVTNAVEALEGGKIVISGGTTKLIASDDGVNASEVGIWNTYSSVTDNKVAIVVSGGVLDVQTNNNQDTDAVDSNNTITMTGGLIVARVPGSGSSSAIDALENTKLNMSGTAALVVCGTVEPTVQGYTKSSSGSWYGSKSYTITYNSGSKYTFTNSKQMNSSCKYYALSDISIS